MWTKDIPKVDGWYWVRSTKSKEVWVQQVIDGGYWFEALSEWMTITKQDNLEFCGPIEEPR